MKHKTKTITMEEIIDMSIEFNVPTQQVVCGYLRAPRGRTKFNKIWGYCSLFDKKCSYRIPRGECKEEQEWLRNKKKGDLHKKVSEHVYDAKLNVPDSWRKK